MVEDNIMHILRNFLKNSSIEYIKFDWVMHLDEIFDIILKKLDDLEFEVIKITLICSEENLIKRITNDILKKLRDKQDIDKSLKRIPLYKNMNTIKIDTSELSISETAYEIIKIIKNEKREEI